MEAHKDCEGQHMNLLGELTRLLVEGEQVHQTMVTHPPDVEPLLLSEPTLAFVRWQVHVSWRTHPFFSFSSCSS